MAADLWEFFGYPPDDNSGEAARSRTERDCPFQAARCTKLFPRDGNEPTGACTVKQATRDPVVICPIRLYANDFQILREIADEAFSPGAQLVDGNRASQADLSSPTVAVFGKGRGGELRLPRGAGGTGGYFVDWVLALLDSHGELDEFVAVEVQTIDTTGSYRAQRDALLSGSVAASTAGLNWENVHKRILPQLLYKGNVLRRETRCRKGLFFVCPGPVYKSFENRLGGQPQQFPYQPGALTFRWYDPGPQTSEGQPRPLVFKGQLTTTLEQVATAIAGTQGLPDRDVYARAIREALG